MVKLILDDQAMSAAIDTGWIKVNASLQKQAIRSSLQIQWKDVTGTLDGTIKVYKSNDTRASKMPTLMSTITVSTATNATDVYELIINTPMEYLKITFTKNNVTN